MLWKETLTNNMVVTKRNAKWEHLESARCQILLQQDLVRQDFTLSKA